MSTCLSCINWTVAGMPRWAFRLGMACCAMNNSKAVTLNHWAACGKFREVPADQMPEREQWLARCGVPTPPRSGSFQPAASAGNWNHVQTLVHGVGKW